MRKEHVGVLRILLAAGSLVMIGVGAGLIFPALGLLLPGALIWIDLSREIQKS